MRRLSDLNVCFLAGTLGPGGAERQLFYIVQALRHSGTRVRVLSLTSGELWEQKIRALNVDVTWIGRARHRLQRVRAIVGELRACPPHILQSQHFFMNTYAALAARWLHVREIGAIRSNARDEIRANGRVFGNLNLHLPRTLVVNSRAAMANAIARRVPPARLHYLSNVVDTEQFSPASSPRNGRALRLLAVGRLIPLKRHDLLLRAAAAVRDAAGPISVTIVGAGPLEPELKQLAGELGLGSCVHFPGALDASALARAYTDTDVFVHTSDYEGTPNVVLEAMSAALPVVSTAVGGVPGLITDGVTGLLIKSGREDMLSHALIRLARDAAMRTRLGDASRQLVESTYSTAALPVMLEGIYNAALE